MEHMNFCRQAIPTLQWNKRHHPTETVRQDCSIALNSLIKASKFMLPEGGRLLPDPELRGLEGFDKLSLPFPIIAIEYRGVSGTRFITIAREGDTDIELQHIVCTETMPWTPSCLILLSRVDPLTPIGHTFLPNVRVLDDECPIEYAQEPAASLLSMLNALACCNVRIERSEPKKAGKKVKAALPFDAYHLLTIDVPGRVGERTGAGAEHRSPREHLRRGHIRRLVDGRRVGVNATIVSAGHGGVVTKDYAVRHGA
jgi:hypothetical protein